MASSYLWRNLGSDGNRKTMTFSAWVKRSGTGTASIFTTGSGAERDMLLFESTGIIQFSRYNSSYVYKLQTNGAYNDTNCWYHIVAVLDTPQSTEADRMKLYVNGEQVTSFSAASYPSQDYQSNYNQNGMTQYVGQDSDGNFDFDGCMSHVHYVDGLALTPSTFGSTDSTTGEWKINTNPTISDYGTHGFFVLKDDNSGTDQSGKGNNLTTQGTITKTEDNPSNVFCTMLPMMNYANGTPTFANGNTVINGSGSAWLRTSGSIGNRTGKFYYEAYLQAYYGSGRPIRIGWDSLDYPRQGADTYFSGFNISSDGFIRGGIAGVDSYDPNADALGVTLAQGDYVGLAIDLDNDLVTCYKNGTVISNVNGLDISGNSNCSVINSKGYQVTPSVNFYAVSTNDNEIYFNFGNGAFGSTQLTGTTYTDSAGRGVFKYQPPTNYLAWCTRNFNE